MHKNSTKTAIITLIISTSILFLLILYPIPTKELFTSTSSFQMEIYYASETDQIDTGQAYSKTLSNLGNSSLEIDSPIAALSAQDVINMHMYSMTKDSVISMKPLPSEKLGTDIFYNISFAKVNDDSAVHSFDKPIELTFYYADDEISGIDEDTLAAYRWDGTEWIELSDSYVNTNLNRITATSQDFSFFGILGEEEEEEEVVIIPIVGGVILPIRNKTCRVADFNEDRKVDLTDFSIAAYWYERPLSKEFKQEETCHSNGDGKIDLVDFSIMIYYWTE